MIFTKKNSIFFYFYFYCIVFLWFMTKKSTFSLWLYSDRAGKNCSFERIPSQFHAPQSYRVWSHLKALYLGPEIKNQAQNFFMSEKSWRTQWNSMDNNQLKSIFVFKMLPSRVDLHIKKMFYTIPYNKNDYHTVPCIGSMGKMLIIGFPFMKIVWQAFFSLIFFSGKSLKRVFC